MKIKTNLFSSVPNGKRGFESFASDATSEETQRIIVTGSPLQTQTLYESPLFAPSYQFPYNPDSLASGNDYSKYDEMRIDDQVKACLGIKKNFLITNGWSIECENEAIKDDVTNALKNLSSFSSCDSNFDQVLYEILSAYDYGFSLSEPVYQIKNGKINYKYIKTRPPHSFYFEIDEYGDVEMVVQSTSRGEISIPPSVFIHHVNQPEFGNPYGISDLKSAYPAWKAKKYVNKFLNIYLERHASPLLVGRSDRPLTPQEAARFQDVLKTVQNSTSVVIPQGVVIEFINASDSAHDAYLKALDYYNMIIARSLFVPDLMGIGGAQTGGGSFSLGQKHLDIFLLAIAHDRNSLEKKINLKLIQPYVRMNYGQNIDCRFVINQPSTENVTEFARIWADAVKAKVSPIMQEELDHFKGLIGFPIGVTEVEREEPAPMPFPPNGNQPPFGKQEEDGEKEEEEKQEKEEKQNTARFKQREKTSYEQRVNFEEIQKTLDIADEELTATLKATARKIYDDYIDQIIRKGLLSKFVPQKINDLEPHFQREMNTIFKTGFKGLFKTSQKQAEKELFKKREVKMAADDFLPEELLKVLEAESFKIVGDYTARVTSRMRNILIDAIKSGASESSIVELLRGEANNETDKWLSTVIRTKTTEIYNMARKNFWDNDDLSKEIIVAYQFSAIMDGRVSDVCASLDGKVFNKDDAHFHNVMPPLHFNCRSLLVPITIYDQYKESNIPSVDVIRERGGNLKTFKDSEHDRGIRQQ